MGEPLFNFENVTEAIARLASDGLRDFELATAGVAPGILKLAGFVGSAGVRVRLNVSLHAATDEKRAGLIPLTRRYGIADILAAAEEYALATRTKTRVRYMLLKGYNDTDEDAALLAGLLRGRSLKLVISSYNDNTISGLTPPEPLDVLEFYNKIKRDVDCDIFRNFGSSSWAAADSSGEQFDTSPKKEFHKSAAWSFTMNKVICVFSSSSNTVDARYFEAASELGAGIASQGDIYLFGGGVTGLMGACAQAVRQGGGRIVGVIPKALNEKGIVYEDCDELVVTGDMRGRKAVMDERSDAFIALPGGFGTIEEIMEIITLKQLRYHNKPIVLLNIGGYYDHLLGQIDAVVSQQFAKPGCFGLYLVTDSVAGALEYIERYVPSDCGERWLTDVEAPAEPALYKDAAPGMGAAPRTVRFRVLQAGGLYTQDAPGAAEGYPAERRRPATSEITTAACRTGRSPAAGERCPGAAPTRANSTSSARQTSTRSRPSA